MTQISEAFEQAIMRDVKAVGMFRIRRSITVTEFMRDILAAVLSDLPQIAVAGLIVHRPGSISIQMTGFRDWKMTPPMPISVTALGTNISFDVSEVQLVEDEETGHPALLVTTASGLKPDLMMVFDVSADEPVEPRQDAPSHEELSTLFIRHQVPKKYCMVIENVVGVAWGAQQLAPKRMNAFRGTMTQESAEDTAELIVQDLIDQQVVRAGLFFWIQLGYWLVKIIAALIQARR
jgi:hypothetical protein